MGIERLSVTRPGNGSSVLHWTLSEIETPDGSRSPAVLHSTDGESRVVLIGLEPGQALGEHQVKEAALVLVADGRVRVDAGGVAVDAGAGELFRFDPDERHSISTESGARILVVLSPWPGDGHYRGDAAVVSAS
jgi:quercetin dioxygenase-like cupin family protein